ncbi:hypothetical protein V7S43_019109 [Phytophthora oleae]|uniref:Uncharacterized protein n=1 Tax=Phytophthora oleae TaxID=2107226 RepID=A0ABD3FSR0_9STRA
MDKDQPGVVQCRKGPDDEPVQQDLRRKVDGLLTEPEKVSRMFMHFLEDLSPPPLNAEKMLELHSKIHPYVPDEFQDSFIYAAPSEQLQTDAKTAKQARREHRAAMAATAKANQDRRGREADDEARPTPKKSRN